MHIVEAPEFDEGVGWCGVEISGGPCDERGVARVMIAASEHDHGEWAPYVGQYVWLGVCAEHRKSIEDDYKVALAVEAKLEADRKAADERVADLEAKLEAAKRERDRI